MVKEVRTGLHELILKIKMPLAAILDQVDHIDQGPSLFIP